MSAPTQAMSPVPQSSSRSSTRHSLSGSSVSKRRTPKEVRFGAYVLGSTLGEGEFGKVKLGWRKDGKHPSQAAIKLIRRDSIPKGSEKENKIHREINALKKLAHPNIVRLEEVLQNEKYIGIVLEYASGGELFEYILEHRYLKESMACRLFAQLVSGVDYMHSKGIVHRDLKLENLLLDKHKNIIITDFGFVNTFKSTDMMKTSCGSPCYAAPELVVSSDPYEGRKVDVWSCGVILYAMLAGYLPFDDDPQNPDGDNIARLYHYITHTPLTFPEYIQPSPRDLLRKIIVSNPKKRIDLKQIRSHPWLSPHAPFLSVTPTEWDKNYTRTKQPVPQRDKINRRLSLMENPSSASLILNRPHNKPMNAKSVSSVLYSNPAAPQTSHTVAIPSSTSSTDISIPSSRSKSPASPAEIYRVGHQRSGSSASIVLQAVVEADKFEISRRNSVQSDPLVRQTIPRSATHNGSFSALEAPARSRSGSVASSTNNPLNFETIVESPERGRNEQSESMLPPLLPPISKSAGSGQHQTSPTPTTTANSYSSKLPSRTNRPRPTSYHPASASSGYQFPSPDFSFLVPAASSETSLTKPLFEKASSTKRSNDLASSSPTKEHRNSWCQPKITEPIVDMAIASGVLTTLSDAAEAQETDEVVLSKSEKRKSAALDSLSNAIDIFSISSKSTATVPNSPILSQSEQSLSNPVPYVVSEKEENTSTDSTVKAPETQETSVDKQVEESKVEEVKEDKLKQSAERLRESSVKEATKLIDPVRNVSKSSLETNNSISRSRTKTSEKENKGANKGNSSSAGASSTKFKRFSMLGFYSHNSSQDVSTPSSSGAPSRKVLEPLNKKNDSLHLINSSGTHGNQTDPQLAYQNKPSSAATSRLSMSAPAKNREKDKEASAAKRVMDFFKRRSIRI